MKKTHFIFDLDDTLTNSYEFNQQMFVETFWPYLNDRDQHDKYLRELHYKSRGKSMHLQFEEAVIGLALKNDPQELVKQNEKLHIDNVHRITIFDDVKKFLKLMQKKDKSVSLCTNRQYGSLNAIIKNNGLAKVFDNVISCLDEGYEKPDPYCLLGLVKKYDLPRERFLYFGDSKTDHDFAYNAGIDFIIVDQYLNQKKFFITILKSFF